MKGAVAITAVLLGLAGCGSAGHPNDVVTSTQASPTRSSPASSQSTIPLGPTPSVVADYAARTARRVGFPVLVPARFPALPSSRTVGGSERTAGKPDAYLGTFNNFGFKGDDGGHVLLGGQRGPFSLHGRAGQTWPRPGQPQPDRALSLPTRSRSVPIQGGGRFQQEKPARILGRTTVHGLDALVLQAPPYPLGLIHGGHVVVIWNQGQHGYLVSVHFASASAPRGTPTLADRITAAINIANSAKADSAANAPVRLGLLRPCASRVESSSPPGGNTSDDITAGSVDFTGLKAAKTLRASDLAPQRHRYLSIKTVTEVNADSTVIVEVARASQRYARLLYDGSKFRDDGRYVLADGEKAVTFVACPATQKTVSGGQVGPRTQFNGGFIVAGPHCVDLVVRSTARPKLVRLKVPFGVARCA